MLTKMLMMMGFYGGKPFELLMMPNNPLKYYEYKLALEADQQVMKKGLPSHQTGPKWLDYGFLWDQVSEADQAEFTRKSFIATSHLQAEAPERSAGVVMKDPRFCVLAEQWLKTAEKKVCVVVYRAPFEVARRMFDVYNKTKKLTLRQWVAVWEEFMLGVYHGCKDHPTVYVDFDDLTHDPHATLQTLARELAEVATINPDSLIPVTQAALDEVLGESFVAKHSSTLKHLRDIRDHEDYPASTLAMWRFLQSRGKDTEALHRFYASKEDLWEMDPEALHRYISKEDLSEAASRSQESVTTPEMGKKKTVVKPHAWDDMTIAAQTVFNPRQVPVLDSSQWTPSSTQAYVTMVSGNDRGYLSGAIVLAQSLLSFDKSRDLLALLTVEVTDEEIPRILTLAGWKVVRVPKLPEAWFDHSPECMAFTFTPSQRLRWGRMFSKLNIFGLTHYTQVVYADTDTLVLKSLEPYFGLSNEFYAERSPSHQGINAGILVLKPSRQVRVFPFIFRTSTGYFVLFTN